MWWIWWEVPFAAVNLKIQPFPWKYAFIFSFIYMKMKYICSKRVKKPKEGLTITYLGSGGETHFLKSESRCRCGPGLSTLLRSHNLATGAVRGCRSLRVRDWCSCWTGREGAALHCHPVEEEEEEEDQPLTFLSHAEEVFPHVPLASDSKIKAPPKCRVLTFIEPSCFLPVCRVEPHCWPEGGDLSSAGHERTTVRSVHCSTRRVEQEIAGWLPWAQGSAALGARGFIQLFVFNQRVKGSWKNTIYEANGPEDKSEWL